MDNLYLKYHGLPGIGIKGVQGISGTDGNNVYFGFINDFFNGVKIILDSNAKVIRRTDTKNFYTNYTDKYLTALAGGNKDILTLYNVYNSSVFYSGSKLDASTLASLGITDAFPTGLDVDVDPATLASAVKLNPSTFLYNNQIYTIKSVEEAAESYDYEIIDNEYTLGENNNIIAIPTVSSTSVVITYEPVDAATVIGQFNDFNSNTITNTLYTALDENADNLDSASLTGYKSYLRNNIYNSSSGANTYFAETVNDMYNTLNVSEGTLEGFHTYKNYDYLTYGLITGADNEGYKIAKNALVISQDVINSTSDETVLFTITNKDGIDMYYYGLPYNMFYGEDKVKALMSYSDTNPSDILNRAQSTALKNYPNLTTAISEYYNKIQYTVDQKFGAYSSGDKENDFVIYELQDDNYITIPTTLSSKYKVGDIIYFYTNKSDYNLTYSIPYMIVVTEELLSADLASFISKAIIANPLDITIFYTNNSNSNKERIYTTNTIICNNANSENINVGLKFAYNSMSNIIDSYYDTNLILSNYKLNSKEQHYLSLTSIISESQETNGNTSIYDVQKTLYFNVSNGSTAIYTKNSSITQIKFTNLCGDETTYTSNVELKGALYDDNIILEDGFLANFDNLDEYLIEGQLYVGMQLEAANYFKDTTNLSNYQYGYELYQSDHLLIQSNCTNEDTLQILIPIYKIDKNFIKNSRTIEVSKTLTIAESFTLSYSGSQDLEWSNNTYTYSSMEEVNGYTYLIYDSGISSTLTKQKKADTTVKLYVSFTIDENENVSYDFYAPTHYDPTTAKYIYAEYGSDIEDFNIKPLKTIYADDINYSISADEELIHIDAGMIQITYDIVAFATNVYGIKYYSKFAKIALNILDDTVNSFSLDIYGETAKLITTNNTSNIIFTTNGITAENSSGVLTVTPNDGYALSSVFINNKDVTTYSNAWANIILSSSKLDEYVYTYVLNENIADVNTSYGNIDCSTIKDYVKSYADTKDDEDGQCQLFYLLNTGATLPSQAERSVVFTAKYYDVNNEDDICYESYKLIQPAFKDTRDFPDVSLYVHTKMDELEKYNCSTNGILCNQFRTYLDITINDFQKTWGTLMTGNAKITMDISIANIHTDPIWVNTYNVPNPLTNRATVKLIPNQTVGETNSYYNYIKFDANIVDNTGTITEYDNIDVSTQCYYSQPSKELVEADTMIINDNEYVPFNTSLIECTTSPLAIQQGLLYDVNINMSGLTLNDIDTENTYHVQLDFEMSNPIIANLYLRFAVTQIRFNYYPDGDMEADPITFTCKTPNVKPTEFDNYLYKYDGSAETYKFISNKLDVMFNPISYTVCPISEETNMIDIQGAVKKVGSDQQIKKYIAMYQSDIYSYSGYYNISDLVIRKNLYLKWTSLLLKTKFLQDNIQNIVVKNIDINTDTIGNQHKFMFNELSPDLLKSKQTFDPISSNKYLSIVYNSIIMNPKLRDSVYTFYYNDEELEAEQYSQLSNNYPVFSNLEMTIEVRNEKLINSIDTWNFEYTNSKSKSTLDNTFVGNINKYGNGYNYLSASVDINQYNSDDTYSLDQTKALNDVYINSIKNTENILIKPISTYEPLKNKYYRTFVYDINWEYPVYIGSNKITSYQIIQDLDYILYYMLKNGQEIESTDYLTHINNVIEKNEQMVPYNELFDLTPRIAMNTDCNTINVLMLRKPSIGSDADYTTTIFERNYNLYKRYFELADGQKIQKLTIPYMYKE